MIMNINKMLSWKIEMIKSSLILPNMHVFKKHINLFCFEKARAAQDEQLLWCVQLNSDWLNIVMFLRECHAWFRIGYVNTRSINRKLKTQPRLRNESSLFSR